jgi:hypothetical protein
MQQRRLASCRIASTVAAAPAVIIAWTSVARRSAGSVSSCTNARSMALRASLRETPTRRASRVGRPDHVLLGPQEDVLPSPLKRVADRRSHSSLLGDLSDI